MISVGKARLEIELHLQLQHRGLKTLQPGRHPETCRGPCQSFVNERQTTTTMKTMACNDAAHGQAQGRDELQSAVVQSLHSFIHEVRLLLLLWCVCVCNQSTQ